MSDPTKFDAVLAAFAAKINLTVEAVKTAILKDAVNDETDASLAILGSASDVDDAAWKAMFPDVKGPVLKNAVATLRTTVNPPVAVPVPPAPSPVSALGGFGAIGNPGAGAPTMIALKQVADDTGFLASLVTGGRLNGTVTPQDAAAAVKVGMAQAIRLFEVPDNLVERIEATANAQEMPADASVYELIDSITEREYAPVLKALGAPVRAVGASQRKAFLAKIQDTLIPGLRRFHAALHAWYEGYKTERSDPSLLIGALTGMTGGLLPMTMTDTSVLRSAAADLMTMTNRLFAGMTAIPVARAMAMDAVRILGQLNDPKYILAAGFTTRDEMLRSLGVAVTEQFARNERTLSTYIINAMDIPNIADAQLPMFAQQLYMIGASLDWDALGTPRVAGENTAVGRTNRREDVGGESRFKPFPKGHDR